MIFWWSGEVSPEVVDAYRAISKQLELQLNHRLLKSALDPTWLDWKWAFIAIIISPVMRSEYPERVRRDQKRKVLEFRLKLSFEDFESASDDLKADMIFQQLHRSIDLMKKWKMSSTDTTTLHNLLVETQTAIRVE